MNKILPAVIFIFSLNAQSEEVTPLEMRDLLIDSIIIDMQDLLDIPEANKKTVSLTNKLVALIKSYETTIDAHVKVMFALKEQLEENNIDVRVD